MKPWIISVVAFVGSVAGIWSTGLWGYIGWTTPNAHASDYKQTIEDIRDFRDEWKCDEYDEELLSMKLELVRMRNDDEDTTELELLIDKVEKKMESIDCSRFDDFG
jgi:hypothetical protein